MQKNVLDFMVHVIVEDEDIDNIMAIALDYSTSFWLDKVEAVDESLDADASEQISRGGTLNVYTIDGQRYKLSKHEFLEGLKCAVEDGFVPIGQSECNGGIDIDLSCADEEMSDIILQYALFGDIEYTD